MPFLSYNNLIFGIENVIERNVRYKCASFLIRAEAQV